MTAPAPTPPALQWDLFCRVIDNYGDVGLCWRLAAQLAGRGQRVRLWLDDASALQWMAPGGCRGVELRAWGGAPPSPDERAPDVMLEAFGCDIAPRFMAWCVARAQACGHRPVWINLEHLSAEPHVERNHGLPSPLQCGPAAGWTRWFFYPGFGAASGGLLREGDLGARQQAFDRGAWRRRFVRARAAGATGAGNSRAADGAQCADAGRRWVALFCYEPPALAELLAQSRSRPGQWLVTPGRASAAMQAALQAGPSGQLANPLPSDAQPPAIAWLQEKTQPQFDELLWACDWNLVRGEDSLVRALWAGQALVWQLYPQHDGAHYPKLQAFLDWLQAPPALRQFHAAWNAVDGAALHAPDDAMLIEWRDCIRAARARLLAQPDLLTRLLGFVAGKR